MSWPCPVCSRNARGGRDGSKLWVRLMSTEAVVDDVGESVAAFEVLALLKKFNFSNTGLLGLKVYGDDDIVDCVATSCW